VLSFAHSTNTTGVPFRTTDTSGPPAARSFDSVPAAASATARVRLRHRHILTELAHQPINSRRYPPATIEP